MSPSFVTFGWFNVSLRGVCHLAQLMFHIFSWPDLEGRVFLNISSAILLNALAKLLVSFICSYSGHTALFISRHFYILFFGLHCSAGHRQPIVRERVTPSDTEACSTHEAVTQMWNSALKEGWWPETHHSLRPLNLSLLSP